MAASEHAASDPERSASSGSRGTQQVAPAIAFALAVIATTAWLEHGLRPVDRASGQKRRALESRLDRVDVLVAGNSMALTGIDPSVFGPNAFNAGMAGQSLHNTTASVLDYLPRFTKLRVVVFTLALPAFEFEWGTPNVPIELPLDLRAYSAIVRLPTDSRFQFVFRRFFHFTDLYAAPVDDNGWLRWEGGGVSGADSAKGAAAALRQSMRPENIARNERALGDAMDKLSARGVRSALVVMPVHASYAAVVGDAARARFYAALNRVATARGVRVYDYQDDPRIEDADYHDGDHLNPNGAKRLSRILANDLRNVIGSSGP